MGPRTPLLDPPKGTPEPRRNKEEEEEDDDEADKRGIKKRERERVQRGFIHWDNKKF